MKGFPDFALYPFQQSYYHHSRGDKINSQIKIEQAAALNHQIMIWRRSKPRPEYSGMKRALACRA
jgi:hypothetical protein